MLLSLSVLLSCQKDKDALLEAAPPPEKAAGRSSSFFDDSQFANLAGFSPQPHIPSSYKEKTKAYLQQTEKGMYLAEIASGLGVACWDCGEAEVMQHIGSRYVYFPLASASGDSALNTAGILVGKFFDGDAVNFYLAGQSLAQEGDAGYWAAFLSTSTSGCQGNRPKAMSIFCFACWCASSPKRPIGAVAEENHVTGQYPVATKLNVTAIQAAAGRIPAKSPAPAHTAGSKPSWNGGTILRGGNLTPPAILAQWSWKRRPRSGAGPVGLF